MPTTRFFRPLVAATVAAVAATLLTATPAAAATDANLVLHYALDETSGTVAHDSSGHGRDGTLVGGAATGGIGGVTLDGTDDHVKLPANILAGLNSITVSTEVFVRAGQGTPYFIWGLGTAATSNSGSGYLATLGDAAYRTTITPGYWNGEQTATSGTAITRGTWKTLTYTLDDPSNTARIYLDGVQVGQNTNVTVTPGSIGGGVTGSNYIGRSNYASDKYLAGSVRDFRIYDTALTAQEVVGLQATDTTRVTRDLAAISLGDLSAVTANLTLPTTGTNGSAITWVSSDASVITTTGTVTRPATGVAHTTLTATVARGSATQTRTFDATVPAADANAAAQQALAAISIPNSADIRGDITLPTTAAGGFDITWTSSNTAVVGQTGLVERPAASTAVTLTASIPGTTATRQIVVTVTAKTANLDTDYDAGYLWTHFAATDYEKIYFGSSTDGLHWSKLNNNRAVLANLAGTLGVRDPHLVRSPEGDEYWILGTDLHAEGSAGGGSWDQVNASQKLVVWRSTDLVHWSDQSLVFAGFANAGNVWAPEAMWDEATSQYYIYWSGRDKTQAGTDDWALRVYVSTTRDFVNFTTPTVWLDESSSTNNADGPNIIDTTIAVENGVYYRFSTSDWRTVVDTAPSLAGPWTRVIARGEDTAHGLSNHIEGLTVYQLADGRWVVMGDSGGYSAYVTSSLASLQFTALPTGATGANTYSFASAFRHGSVLRLSSAEEARIVAAFGSSSGPAAKPVNAAGEILRYSFDGGTGTTVQDVTGNGQNGTIVGGATWQTGSLKLDGTDDYVDLPDDLLAGVTDITVQADVWIDSAQTGAYFIYGLGNTAAGVGNGYLFTSGNAYRTSLATGNWTTEQTVSQGSNLPRGQWAHLTYTLSGTTATIYLDGVKVGTGTVTTDPKDIGGGYTAANYIGRSNYDADNRFRGQIREFAIYNRALTSTEVLASSGNTTVLADATLQGDVLKTAPIVDQAARTVVFPVKPGTNRAALTPTYTTAAGVTAAPASGSTIDLTSPATVTLTPAGGGATTTWTLSAVEMRSPVLPGLYADPNIAVFGDTYYIYATSDGVAGWGGNTFYVWSSKNLVDWERSATPILTLDGANGTVPWATGNAWAPTIIEKGGKYYFYFSGHNPTYNRKTLGVAVSDSPTGPFVAQPTAMITNGESVNSGQAIDPAAFTDPATGKSYLFWGNGSAVYGELSDDMLSVKAGTIKRISGLTDFREGAFVNYRQGLYHLTYAIDDTGSVNYRTGYATATSIDGPWTYRGVILEKKAELGILATGHSSIIQVPGTDDWYIAYHRFAIPGGDGTHRETTIDRLTFDPATGLMQKVVPTLSSVSPQTIAPPAPALAITATASTRCVAGKVVLTVVATNGSGVPVSFETVSSHGSKTAAGVAAGKTTSSAFTTRLAGVPAGQVTVTGTATVDGTAVTASVTAAYAALSCG